METKFQTFLSKKNKISYEKKDREFVKAAYLMGSKSAFNNGHAALLLVDKDGKGVFYSTIFSVEKAPKVLFGKDAPLKIYRREMESEDIQKYFETGRIPKTNDNLVQFYLSNFDKYIIIPIQNKEQGQYIYNRAEQIYKKPDRFNLYAYNCNHVTQDMLAAGGLNFTSPKGNIEEIRTQAKVVTDSIKDRKFLKALYWAIVTYHKNYEIGTIPNGAFEKGVEWAKDKNYDYGTIEPKKNEKDTSVKNPQPKKELPFPNFKLKDAVKGRSIGI